MEPQQQAKFEGWAIVDVMGHQQRPGYAGGQYVPAGTTVKEGAVQGYSKLIGSGSIYSITPCTKEAALAAVEEIQPRPLTLVDIGSNTTRAITGGGQEAAIDGDCPPAGTGDEDEDDE